MKGIINVVCNDLTMFKDNSDEFFANFYYSQDSLKESQSITVNINEQIKNIFENKTVDFSLFKRLERMLQLSLGFSPVILTFVKKEETFYLQESLKGIYEKSYLAFKDAIVPNTVDAKITEAFCLKERIIINCELQAATSNVVRLDITEDINKLYTNYDVITKFKRALKKTSINKRVFLDNLLIYLEGKIIKLENINNEYVLWTTLEMLIGV